MGAGPGLLESVYETCLARELELQAIPFERQMAVPVRYKDIDLDCGVRLDLYVDKRVIVELKAVDELAGIHKAQLLTYMRLMSCQLGLLINFNVEVLRQGVKRMSLQ